MPIENILLWIAVLLFVSVISSKISDKFAVPVLLLFLGIGMLSGSEGIGGIYFDNAHLAKSIGVVALIFIIFAGGLDTDWKETRSIVWQGVSLSTLGVLLTAVITGLFSIYILDFSIWEGMLLGSIISSTDAAVIFAVLRSKRISLKQPLKPLLEFESGSNDPMAIFLTMGFIRILTLPDSGILHMIPGFVMDMGMGALVGYFMTRAIVYIVKKIKLDYDGLYPVVMISLVLFTYCIAIILKGNGILAVYLAGLGLGKADYPHKKYITRFHDGLAWICQIAMFVTLGLLVYPSRIISLFWAGMLITFLLMFVARPISVYLCLLPFKMSVRKKALVSWVGLKGSVPIILATFPFTAGLPQADVYFNIVFFVVIASVFIQGTSIPFVARRLKLDEPLVKKHTRPIELQKVEEIDAELTEVIVPHISESVGKKMRDLDIPEKCVVILVSRDEKYIFPSPSMVIQGGDVLLVLADDHNLGRFQDILARTGDLSES